MKPLPSPVWNTFKSAGIARRTRGRRGGASTTKIHRFKPITPALRDSESFANAADMPVTPPPPPLVGLLVHLYGIKIFKCQTDDSLVYISLMQLLCE